MAAMCGSIGRRARTYSFQTEIEYLQVPAPAAADGSAFSSLEVVPWYPVNPDPHPIAPGERLISRSGDFVPSLIGFAHSMSLTVKEKVALRGQAMRLKPALKVGRAGFSESVRAQLDALLTTHKLVKVRLELDDRKARAVLADEIATATGAALIGATGKMAVFYRIPELDADAEASL